VRQADRETVRSGERVIRMPRMRKETSRISMRRIQRRISTEISGMTRTSIPNGMVSLTEIDAMIESVETMAIAAIRMVISVMLGATATVTPTEAEEMDVVMTVDETSATRVRNPKSPRRKLLSLMRFHQSKTPQHQKSLLLQRRRRKIGARRWPTKMSATSQTMTLLPKKSLRKAGSDGKQ
jgi:hypothetical protein